MEMKKYKLGDILVNHDRRRIPLSSKVRSGRKGNFRYYGAQGVVDYIDDYIFDGEYVLIAEDGENLRSRNQNVANLVSGQFWVNNHAHIVTTNEKCDLHYFYYAFNFLQIDGYISGSAQPKLSQDSLNRIEMTIPDLQTQKGIASFLFTIDKRIENLRAQNRVLEQTAKTVYDYTFLQCAGHQTTYNKTLNRNIPAEWEVKKMEEVLQPIERGISYSSEEIKSGKGMPMYNLACFDKQGNYRSGELKFYSGEYKTSDLIKLGDMLIACTDLTRNADIIGTPVIVNDEYDLFVYTTDLAKITPKNEEMKYHIYFWLKNSSYRKYIKPFASGTNVLHLNVRGVLDYPILVPNSSVLKKFNAQVEPIFRKQLVNAKQIETLTTQRNTLLPLLMTGQVEV